MARKVFISSEMSSDDKLLEVGEKDQQAVLLWPWILLTFDDWGRAEANAKVLKARIFPSLDSLSAEDIERALLLFGETGLVELYEVSGRRYMRIPEERWYKFQTHMNRTNRRPGKDKMESDFPAPEGIGNNAPQTPTGNHGAPQTPENPHGSPQFPVPSPSPSPSKDQQHQQHARAREIPEVTERSPVERDPAAYKAVHSVIERTFGILATDFQVSRLLLYALDDRMELGLVIRAIEQAALGQKDLRYAIRTLGAWREKGILTISAATQEAEEFRERKELRHGNGTVRPGRARDSTANRENQERRPRLVVPDWTPPPLDA